MLKAQMDAAKAAEIAKSKSSPSKTSKSNASPTRSKYKGKKRVLTVGSDSEDDTVSKRVKLEDTRNHETTTLTQPALVTGGTLMPYQLKGVEWMISLDQNGISGILGGHFPFSHSFLTHKLIFFKADEMGLGKVCVAVSHHERQLTFAWHNPDIADYSIQCVSPRTKLLSSVLSRLPTERVT
jgi:SNF2 family DNA or RNA helicase